MRQAAWGASGPGESSTIGERAHLAACRHVLRTVARRRGVAMKLGQLIGHLDIGPTAAERAGFAAPRRSGRRDAAVLTTERAEGVALDELVASADQAARDRAGRAVWRFYFEGAHRHGRYDTDPQPANLRLAPDGRGSLLDPGRVQALSDGFRAPLDPRAARLLRARSRRPAARHDRARRGAAPRAPRRRRRLPALARAYQPFLREEPFAFSADYLSEMWRAVFAANHNLGELDYVAEMVVLPQLAFGVDAILAALGARLALRPLLLDLLYDGGAARPPPFSPVEIDALLG